MRGFRGLLGRIARLEARERASPDRGMWPWDVWEVLWGLLALADASEEVRSIVEPLYGRRELPDLIEVELAQLEREAAEHVGRNDL